MECNRVASIAIIAVLHACVCAQTKHSKVVKLRQGPVRGYLDHQDGIYKYFDIPYATAPTGEDRFKAPLPPPKWTSVREAVDRGIICPQKAIANKTTFSDCLIANVLMPDTNITELPVVVLIHGGGFQTGSGSAEFYKHLVQTNKIVAVSFNYRLGAHGFLCLGTPFAPGNAGMKDQVALLRWVRDNIASFGGNPNDVTIDGCSAGGSSVDLVLLSKAAKGLFHKAMVGSGGSLSVWSVQPNPIGTAKNIAMRNNFTNVDNIEDLEEFYRTVSLETLYNPNGLDFVPCVERDIGEERFLDEAPESILKNKEFKNVPTIYGYANLEGYIMVIINFKHFKTLMNVNFSLVLPSNLQFPSEEEKREVGNRIREFYFHDKLVNDDTIMEFMEYFTDITMAYPIIRAAKLQVEAGNNRVYLYEFSFAEGNVVLPKGINATVKGATHCKQSMVMTGRSNVKKSPDYSHMSSILQEMWLNFITTGAPAHEGSLLPTWPSINQEGSPYMELTLPPQLHGSLRPGAVQLWDDIYDKYYKMPIPPNSAV